MHHHLAISIAPLPVKLHVQHDVHACILHRPRPRLASQVICYCNRTLALLT
jgi:hypothetical protein